MAEQELLIEFEGQPLAELMRSAAAVRDEVHQVITFSPKARIFRIFTLNSRLSLV